MSSLTSHNTIRPKHSNVKNVLKITLRTWICIVYIKSLTHNVTPNQRDTDMLNKQPRNVTRTRSEVHLHTYVCNIEILKFCPFIRKWE